MSIVIGASTSVNFRNSGACVVSASWGANPNTQRLYCLGSWDVYDEYRRPTQSLNLTIYAPGQSYGTLPSTGCSNDGRLTASISPQICGTNVPGVSGNDWVVTSYGFTKDDASMPGQESWVLQRWPSDTDVVPPTYVLRGIAEGQATDNAGVWFTGPTTQITSGNVSAGGIGRADSLEMGQVSAVGGGTIAYGQTGQASVSIPWTPLWV